MLADSIPRIRFGGTLSQEVKSISINNIINFMARVLPVWRDDPDRPTQTAEDVLTNHLASALNAAAHLSFDVIQFSPQNPAQSAGNRTLDLAAKPLLAGVEFEGRRRTIYDVLLPIECKRLPTPPGPRRDDREYVFSRLNTTGGIHRFKAGHHGPRHTRAVMVGYVQSESPNHWYTTINDWLRDLAAVDPNWNTSELLDPVSPVHNSIFSVCGNQPVGALCVAIPLADVCVLGALRFSSITALMEPTGTTTKPESNETVSMGENIKESLPQTDRIDELTQPSSKGLCKDSYTEKCHKDLPMQNANFCSSVDNIVCEQSPPVGDNPVYRHRSVHPRSANGASGLPITLDHLWIALLVICSKTFLGNGSV